MVHGHIGMASKCEIAKHRQCTHKRACGQAHIDVCKWSGRGSGLLAQGKCGQEIMRERMIADVRDKVAVLKCPRFQFRIYHHYHDIIKDDLYIDVNIYTGTHTLLHMQPLISVARSDRPES